MRIAFVDLLFSWPPPGGAQADLFYTIRGIQALGHDVHLFAPCYDFKWAFNAFSPDDLPFPATPLWFTNPAYRPAPMARAFRDAVDAWRPDLVFAGFGRYYKPHVLAALSRYPQISRYYMYEHLCIRDFSLYKAAETCPNDIFHTGPACRRCAFACWSRDLRSGKFTTYALEFDRARAWTPRYERLFRETLGNVRAAIVNNDLAKARLEGFCPNVRYIPGGVDLAAYPPPAPRPDAPGRKTVILMVGRADDPLKGADVLIEAGLGLSGVRDDFEVWITSVEPLPENAWLRNAGWRDHAGIRDLYHQADIVVVPSVWDEPYGLVAVEAMAAALPVVASRAGGLPMNVRDGETGLLFAPGDSAELALRLASLLDDPALRARMGAAGRARVEAENDWAAIIQRHYPALLEEALR